MNSKYQKAENVIRIIFEVERLYLLVDLVLKFIHKSSRQWVYAHYIFNYKFT